MLEIPGFSNGQIFAIVSLKRGETLELVEDTLRRLIRNKPTLIT